MRLARIVVFLVLPFFVTVAIFKPSWRAPVRDALVLAINYLRLKLLGYFKQSPPKMGTSLG
jgi:hypothetical protein